MAKPTLEVLTLHTPPDVPKSEALAYNLCHAILDARPSAKSSWYARGIEDPNLLMIFLGHAPEDWSADGLDASAKYKKQRDFYANLLAQPTFAVLTTQPPKLQHVPIPPHTLTGVISHPNAGVLKLTNAHFLAGTPQSTLDKWDALNAEHERKSFQPWDGYLASTWGWAQQTEEYKDVGPTRVWSSLWTWVSMENHLGFMKSPAFKELINDCHAFDEKGLRGIEIWHVHVTDGPRKE